MANNTLFSASGNIHICDVPLAQWQSQGNDLGTTASAYTPTLDDDLIGWARERLLP